jgi:hypothetical protein
VSDVSEASADGGWQRPIPPWTEDPFAGRTTVHGLPSDEVRSALHKHVRCGRVEQAITAALELSRTDADHEAELWRRLQVIAVEDVGRGDPAAVTIVRACHEAALDAPSGSAERATFVAHAAGHLAATTKDPRYGEIAQLVVHLDLTPEIPDEALCVHTRRGQEMGRTMDDWFRDGTRIEPEAADRDTSYHERLAELYHLLDPGVG